MVGNKSSLERPVTIRFATPARKSKVTANRHPVPREKTRRHHTMTPTRSCTKASRKKTPVFETLQNVINHLPALQFHQRTACNKTIAIPPSPDRPKKKKHPVYRQSINMSSWFFDSAISTRSQKGNKPLFTLGFSFVWKTATIVIRPWSPTLIQKSQT